MDTPSSVSAQEKLSAALASIVFFAPLLMNVKTGYVVKYMKQGFFINLLELSLSVVSIFLWFLSPILGIVSMICFFTSVFLAFQAYSGKEYSIVLLSENAEKIIQKMGLVDLFTPGK